MSRFQTHLHSGSAWQNIGAEKRGIAGYRSPKLTRERHLRFPITASCESSRPAIWQPECGNPSARSTCATTDQALPGLPQPKLERLTLSRSASECPCLQKPSVQKKTQNDANQASDCIARKQKFLRLDKTLFAFFVAQIQETTAELRGPNYPPARRNRCKRPHPRKQAYSLTLSQAYRSTKILPLFTPLNDGETLGGRCNAPPAPKSAVSSSKSLYCFLALFPVPFLPASGRAKLLPAPRNRKNRFALFAWFLLFHLCHLHHLTITSPRYDFKCVTFTCQRIQLQYPKKGPTLIAALCRRTCDPI